MCDNQRRQDEAVVAICALDEANVDAGQLTTEELVTDFLANLMHLEGYDWVMARGASAESHFEAERDDDDDDDD